MTKTAWHLLALAVVLTIAFPPPAQASRTRQIVLGTVVGTGLGIAAGGLFFVTTQSQEKALLTSVATGAGVGLFAGAAWGVFWREPLVEGGLDGWPAWLGPPTLRVTVQPAWGKPERTVHVGVLHLRF